MDYQHQSKEDLVLRIQELETLIEEIKKENVDNEKMMFAWSGNLGNWYWDIKTNTVTHNPLKVTTLGYSMEEIPEQIGFDFFTEMLHPDDYENVMENMRQHLHGSTPAYEAEYRIKTKAGGWRWYQDIGKVTRRGPQGEPLFASGIVFDITERKELQIKIENQNALLKKLTITDGLTQLLNHQAINKKLDMEIKRAQRYNLPLSLLMMDIDNFKAVNDRFGHLVGDTVLKSVAKTIEDQIRKIDHAGRYGGEEFMIIFPNITAEDAQIAAERIKKEVSCLNFKQDLKITVSGGICQYAGQEMPQFIDQADQLLYLAKRSGKNRIQH